MTAEDLARRAATSDVVVAYAMALDARDWRLFRSIFEDEIDIDYSSLGSIKARMAADTWVDRGRLLGEFVATQHKVCNFVHAFDGDLAMVTSYVDAAHFISVEGEDLYGFAVGTYVHQLALGDAGWKIRGCAFDLKGHPGGRAMFDRVFALARAAFASRTSI